MFVSLRRRDAEAVSVTYMQEKQMQTIIPPMKVEICDSVISTIKSEVSCELSGLGYFVQRMRQYLYPYIDPPTQTRVL